VWHSIDRPRLVRLCAVLSGDRLAAEDLAQETLLEAWRQRHKLHDERGADRWLAAVARNVCLRWSRRRTRLDIPVAAVPEPAAEGEWDDAPSLLAPLGPELRDLLVERYVEERTNRELAARLGISEDAVAMRLVRAKRALRDVLLEGDWRRTGVWCPVCGAEKLAMCREVDPPAVAFRCAGCAPGVVAARYALDNPVFEQLVGELQRPTAILRRAGAWAVGYFGGGAGRPRPCTRCGAATPLHALRAPDRGLWARCARCGEEVWSSLTGIAIASPAVRALRVGGRRVRIAGVHEHRAAVVVSFASPDADAPVAVAFDVRSFALLSSG
jgi:RNA polymerase sigma-70 factor (ECF subfamily)